MLIGDKGESGGRRWEVAGFALGAFSDSPKVHRWGGGKISGIRIIYQSQGQTLGGGRITGFRIFDQSSGQTLGATFS